MSLKNTDPQLQRFINGIASKGSGKSLKCSIAVAKCYAQNLELPLTPIGQLQAAEYFDMNMKIQADLFLSKVNEVVLIDKPTCLDLISRFYSYRVSVFYATTSPIRIRPQNGIVDFFCIDRFFDPSTLQEINQSGEELLELTRGFSSLFLKI